MKKLLQKHHGFPRGNCVQTSYACLLEIPVDKIPRFDPAHLKGNDQTQAERRWLNTIGLDLVRVPIDKGERPPKVPSDLYHLMSIEVVGQDDNFHRGHRVVGRGGKIAWNPHPSTRPIRLKAFYFVVPKKEEKNALKR